jgi:hypothetical protein
MAVQSVALVQSTLVTMMAPAGAEAAFQSAPPRRVVSTVPDGASPLNPTAMQRRTKGHEMPVSAGAVGKESGSAVHDLPPSTVASMTAVVGGDGTEEVVVLVLVLVPAPAAGVVVAPGVPTAQQWSESAQETASS